MRTLAIFISLLSMSVAVAEAVSWQDNYKHPDYFSATEDEASIGPIAPNSEALEGFLIEVHQVVNYGDFAQALTWLMLNRGDQSVTVRPILADKPEGSFHPERAFYMDPMQVQKGRTLWIEKDPEAAIIDGFHIHIEYLPGQEDEAGSLFSAFGQFIASNEIFYSDFDSYPDHANGPHVRAGWEIKFEKCGNRVFDPYGKALAWLILNHGEVPLYSHAKTWIYGENEERLISHLDYAFYAGVAPNLDQWFFYDPQEVRSGLYRWDSQLPLTRTVDERQSSSKQDEVIQFWLGDSTQDMSKRWFAPQDPTAKSPLDQEIFERLQRDIILAMTGAYDSWLETARGKVALIILLDQFPRNIYRGSSQAFAYDETSLKITKQGIALGEDRELGFTERLFFYLPLEHSEDLADQRQAVDQIAALAAEVPPYLEDAFVEHHRMAVMHYDAIANFGRFPWRDTIQHRQSSQDEESYLHCSGNRA